MSWMRRFFSEKPADDVPAWLRDATVRTLTQEDLAQQATVLRDQGDLDGALALYRKQESLCRKRPLNVQGLAYSLANQATLLAFGKKQPQEGLPLAMEALRLAKDYHRIEMLDEFQEVIQDIQDAIETDVR